MDVKTILTGATDAALEAGELLRVGFGGIIEPKSKEGRHNILMQFDIAAERLLHERLKNVATGFPYNVNDDPKGCIDQFPSLVSRGLPIRRLGGEVALHSWDMAARVLLVATNGSIHNQLIDALEEVRE